jgi:hypothetical protein
MFVSIGHFWPLEPKTKTKTLCKGNPGECSFTLPGLLPKVNQNLYGYLEHLLEQGL